MYDTITIGSRKGQVKLWSNTRRVFGLNARVPSVKGSTNYSIVMREGDYVNIMYNSIVSWANRPYWGVVVYNKWGKKWDSMSREEMEGYFFSRPLQAVSEAA